MAENALPDPESIRAARLDKPKARDRDLADGLGISEAQLVAAHIGHGVTRIDANPDRLIAGIAALGEVMALTRNESAVHEKTGTYGEYRGGDHAGMIVTEEIDLRVFPSHWVYGFAIEKETEQGVRRSLQVFDAAGDSVHKIFLRDGSDLAAYAALVAELRLPEQSDVLLTAPRKPTEAPFADESKLDILRKEWARMTDTHQFMRLTSKLKMNRLGAYRIVGEPHARKLETAAFNDMLTAVQAQGTEIMIFVGNRGCIQIHTGPIGTLRPMGPWQNVMDPRFNLHLRADHIAEVWAVNKPTQRGDAISVEAFDKEGGLILQVFGLSKEGRDSRPAWNAIVADLPSLQNAEVA